MIHLHKETFTRSPSPSLRNLANVFSSPRRAWKIRRVMANEQVGLSEVFSGLISHFSANAWPARRPLRPYPRGSSETGKHHRHTPNRRSVPTIRRIEKTNRRIEKTIRRFVFAGKGGRLLPMFHGNLRSACTSAHPSSGTRQSKPYTHKKSVQTEQSVYTRSQHGEAMATQRALEVRACVSAGDSLKYSL